MQYFMHVGCRTHKRLFDLIDVGDKSEDSFQIKVSFSFSCEIAKGHSETFNFSASPTISLGFSCNKFSVPFPLLILQRRHIPVDQR